NHEVPPSSPELHKLRRALQTALTFVFVTHGSAYRNYRKHRSTTILPKKDFLPVPEAASTLRGTGADPRRTGELRTTPKEETAPPPEPRDAERAAGRYLPRGKGNGRTRRYPRAHSALPTSRPRLATPLSQTEPLPPAAGSDVCGRSGPFGSPCGESGLSAGAPVNSRLRCRPCVMLRGLGSWLGLERVGEEKLLAAEEGSSPAEEVEEPGAEPAAQSQERVEPQEDTDALLSQAKGFGSYLFNFATAATKKISESVAETAQTIKKSVEEGKIDSIIDKVFYFSILDLKYLLAYCCVIWHVIEFL
uniref:Uncharacterized protein n=1 Tax=Meleagris gallopavo TaxID=9103 RepID=A0A803XYZ3_MELGA